MFYSSVVIDHLKTQFCTKGIACLYADYKDQTNQNLVHILGSFLRQLLTTAIEPIPDQIIQKLHHIQHQGGKLGAEETMALLKIRLDQLKCAFICIDAVDELEPQVRQQLLNVLKKELGTNNTRLFLTGRQHIESEIQKYFQVEDKYRVIICLHYSDIQEFLQQQIRDGVIKGAMDNVLERNIISEIIRKSRGM